MTENIRGICQHCGHLSLHTAIEAGHLHLLKSYNSLDTLGSIHSTLYGSHHDIQHRLRITFRAICQNSYQMDLRKQTIVKAVLGGAGVIAIGSDVKILGAKHNVR